MLLLFIVYIPNAQAQMSCDSMVQYLASAFYEMIDIQGVVVKYGRVLPEQKIEISNLAKGFYFLRSRSDDQVTLCTKFVEYSEMR